MDFEAIGIDRAFFGDGKQFVLENLFRGDNLHTFRMQRTPSIHREIKARGTKKDGVRHSTPHSSTSQEESRRIGRCSSSLNWT
jgi:hypothetical protein